MDINAFFAPNGPLSTVLKQYECRPDQVDFALTVADILQRKTVFFAEAATGIGKSLAYLVPALLSGERVIISTATKALQEQLLHHDWPIIQAALRLPAHVVTLKGRSSYLCLHHFERFCQGPVITSKEDARDFTAIQQWARKTTTGDYAELQSLTERSFVRSAVTSTSENCLGALCPRFKDCYVMRSRRLAMQAEIVIVNHALFFSDYMMKGQGTGSLLPHCHGVIFDEAHQLPEIARRFFGRSVANYQLLQLCQHLLSDSHIEDRDIRQLIEQAIGDIHAWANDLLQAFGETPVRKIHVSWHDFLATHPSSIAALAQVLRTLSRVEQQVALHAEHCVEDQPYAHSLRGFVALLQEFFSGDPSVDWVKTVYVGGLSVQLSIVPLNIAPLFRAMIHEQACAWLFVSATLSVHQDIQYFATELGLEAYRQHYACWRSPFDHMQQAMLFIPGFFPYPNSVQHGLAVANIAVQLICASQGGALLLCTSLQAAAFLSEKIADLLRQQGRDYPVFSVLEGNRVAMLRAFCACQQGVLVGSQMVWEGIDIPGVSLRLVIIEKIPFVPQTDPFVAAKSKYIEKMGKSGFLDYQLPRAILALRQGAGRLIRHRRDKGAIVILDSRVLTRSYGAAIRRSLPRMTMSTSLADVCLNLADCAEENRSDDP